MRTPNTHRAAGTSATRETEPPGLRPAIQVLHTELHRRGMISPAGNRYIFTPGVADEEKIQALEAQVAEILPKAHPSAEIAKLVLALPSLNIAQLILTNCGSGWRRTARAVLTSRTPLSYHKFLLACSADHLLLLDEHGYDYWIYLSQHLLDLAYAEPMGERHVRLARLAFEGISRSIRDIATPALPLLSCIAWYETMLPLRIHPDHIGRVADELRVTTRRLRRDRDPLIAELTDGGTYGDGPNVERNAQLLRMEFNRKLGAYPTKPGSWKLLACCAKLVSQAGPQRNDSETWVTHLHSPEARRILAPASAHERLEAARVLAQESIEDMLARDQEEPFLELTEAQVFGRD